MCCVYGLDSVFTAGHVIFEVGGGFWLRWCQRNDSWVLSNQFCWTAVLCATAILHIQASFPNQAAVEEQKKGGLTLA